VLQRTEMRLSQRKRRMLCAAAAGLVLFGIVGFLVLPPIVRAQGEKRLSAELGRNVSIGKVRMNPFALSLSVEDVDVRERDGSHSFLGWHRLYVRFDALASVAGDWVLGAIELDGFHAGVVVNPDGSFNFSDLLAKLSAPPGPPAKPGRPVRIGRLNVTGARVDFSDQSLKTPFSTQVGPLTFELTDFRTVGARGAPYRFEAVTDAAERLAWSGTLSADPVESQGEFDVENLVLKKYAPYFEGMTRADLEDGKLTAHGRYVADFDPAKRVLTLGDAELHLRSLSVAERSTGKPAVQLNALDVTGLQADALARRASIGQVTLTGGHLEVRRDKDGSVNLLSLLKPADAVPAHPAGGAASGSPGIPQVTVGEVVARDSVVEIRDEAMPHAAQLSLGGIQFSLKNFALTDGATMPLHLSFAWAPRGAVQVDGTVALKPALKADLKVNVVALDLLPLSPYLEQRVNARITQGSVSTASSLDASMSGGQVGGDIEGDVSIDTFGLVDGARSGELAGFSRLALNGLKVATSPQLAVSIRQVAVGAPYARVRIEKDKSLNLLALVAPSPSPASHPPGVASPPPKIEVGSVDFVGGDFSFSDRSVEPNVRVSLSGFAGSISGLSSENMARADVRLKGLVDGEGPVEITGKLDPLGVHRYVGLKIGVTNVDLLFASPYMGKYAGYELARGQLGVDSTILVDGDAVDSTNVVTLKQFTFGNATPGPDATPLPVRLGVALLKDTDGNIVIDLPVQGSMGNPDFRIGKVVLRVIVNLLTKAAVSPFSLVGSMFGGGGDELAYQEFAPGSSDLEPSELPKLETLAKALANRPSLSLGLEGSYDSAADTYALKRSKLAGLLRRKIWEERRVESPSIAPPDELVIRPGENAAMVKRMFDAKFPPGTQFGTPLPPAPVVAPPPPGPAPGLLRHIVDIVTFKGERDQRAAKKEAARLSTEHEETVAKAVATGLPLAEMSGRLAESMEVTDNDLAALASARARNVRNRLIESGHIAADRLFLSQSTDLVRKNKGPRVLLSFQ
jgi:hypothetical protein